MRTPGAVVGLFALACAARTLPSSPHPPAPPATADRRITIIGTNDLHGHLEPEQGNGGVALLGGYLANLRRAHAVVLVDAGDLFQGTLVSNLAEGAPVVRAMNALGYHAAAIGNHEFDYGPVGPDAVARSPDQDPQGALRARAREAKFRLLGANVVDESTGRPVAWENVSPRVDVVVGGVRVAIVGGVTADTPTTTNTLNLRGLRFLPLDEPIREQAEAARRDGAEVVVVAVHAGSKCKSWDNPNDPSSCDARGEVFRLAQHLPPGLVDVIVAGHTHAVVAHRIGGVAVVESMARGQAFGRVDLTISSATHRVVESRIFPPQSLTAGASYEGAPVVPDPVVARTFADDVSRAAALRARSLGVTAADPIWRSYDVESPLGNLVADLLRQAAPRADFALQNGGGLRAGLPTGPLHYDALYEALPFDNRLAVVTMRGSTLRQLLEDNYGGGGNGFLSVSGLSARAHCRPQGGVALELRLAKSGAPLQENHSYRVAVADFLALGGDSFGVALRAPGTKVEILWDRPVVRDAVAALLEGRAGTLRAADLANPARPRVVLPGERPVCAERSPHAAPAR
jgi:5'-nucleotidase